jgi:DNA modification methylase
MNKAEVRVGARRPSRKRFREGRVALREPPQLPLEPQYPIGVHDWSGHTQTGLKWEVHRGDSIEMLKTFTADRFQCAVTSPPYFWQRDYKVDGQIGLEKSIDGYVTKIIACMDQVRRVLRKDGVLFLNLGDTYYSAKGMPKGDDKKNKARRFGLRAVDASGLGVPRKTLLGLPWRIALGMIAKGWVLRAPIVWHRHNSIPEPTARDRPWRTYEHVFLFSKSPRYNFLRDALGDEEDVWKIPVRMNSSNGVHSAGFPEALADKCIRCGSKEGDEVLDPFAGAGTTLVAALKSGRRAVGVDLKQDYCDYMVKRLGAL